jgi:hypothetical protein
MTFNGLHGVTSQKIEIWITVAVVAVVVDAAA